jgi:D-psicose/D-tagatose/L-ribulose 3-epimerase
MQASYRFAICNELFQDVPLASVCRVVRELGYEGLEIAPFTLSSDPASLSSAERREICDAIQNAGLRFVGLHWLLSAPPDLQAVAANEAQRKRTWDYIHLLVDLCADLSGCDAKLNGVVVFGSPKQRSSRDGLTPKEAADIFTHELAHLAPHAESRGVQVLVEPLAANQTDVVNTLAEAATIVRQIGSPAVQTMFDVHNAIDEAGPHSELIRRYASHIRHVHVNELDGREPGTGDYDFGALLQTLADLNYSGWVSLEAFDFSRDPREVAARAIQHLKANLPAVAASA